MTMPLPNTSWTDESMPTTSTTDESLVSTGLFVEPGFVEDDFVFEDSLDHEVLTTTSWTDE